MNWLYNLFVDREFGAIRSSLWEGVRKGFITNNPLCAVCGVKGSLLKSNEVHHILPFHLHPDLELNPANFITLCRDHHYEWGHLFNWSSWNETVKEDSHLWALKITNRPK